MEEKIMKEIYVRPTTTSRSVYMERCLLLNASEIGVNQASEGPQVEGGLVSGDGILEEHFDAWGDAKAQHSWGDDAF